MQLRLYRDSLRRENKRLKISEWIRRLFVWTFRFAQWFGWRDWKDLLWIVTPATVIDWHRRRYTDFWTLVCAEVKRAGRPEIPMEVQRTEEPLNYLVPLFSFSEAVICQRLLEYKIDYNEDRTHSANSLDSPLGRETPDALRFATLVAIPCVGGLHHRYALREERAA